MTENKRRRTLSARLQRLWHAVWFTKEKRDLDNALVRLERVCTCVRNETSRKMKVSK